MPMRLLCLDAHDPALNLAVEEILTREADAPVFLLWRNEPSIIIGRNQNTAAEIDGDFVAARGIHVVRRITGGGAVYHDLGNVNYSWIEPGREWGPESAGRFTAPVVAALRHLGIDAVFEGRNDILVAGCKVSGCARGVLKDQTLFHGTLLFDSDLAILGQALRPDPEKIRAKGIASVRARVTNLREHLPPEHAALSVDGFLRHLQCDIARFFHEADFAAPDAQLLRRADLLAAEKYRTWEWNYGSSADYAVRKRLRFAKGMIQAEFNVVDNRIAELRFTGDFFGILPAAELADALRGCEPRMEKLLARLDGLDVEAYVSGLAGREMAELLTVG